MAKPCFVIWRVGVAGFALTGEYLQDREVLAVARTAGTELEDGAKAIAAYSRAKRIPVEYLGGAFVESFDATEDAHR